VAYPTVLVEVALAEAVAACPPFVFFQDSYRLYVTEFLTAAICLGSSRCACSLFVLSSPDVPIHPYAVARLIEKYGADAKLPDLRQMLADCQKTKTANIYDRCRAVFEKPPY
jgi:hypothetical protein